MTRALVLQTLREVSRSRAPLVVLGWAALSALAAPTLASLVMGQASRGVTDLLLSSLWLVGSALAGAIALNTAAHDSRAVPLFMARGTDPAHWMLARQLGLLLGVATVAASGVIAWCAIALMMGTALPPALPAWALLVTLEWAWIAATSRLLCLVLPPLPSAAAMVVLWLVAHLESPYAALADAQGGLLPVIHSIVWTLLPNLDRLDLSAELAHRTPADPLAVTSAALYGLAWWGAVCLISAVIARSRDWT